MLLFLSAKVPYAAYTQISAYLRYQGKKNEDEDVILKDTNSSSSDEEIENSSDNSSNGENLNEEHVVPYDGWNEVAIRPSF